MLLVKILVGELKPGDKLPPDRLLAEQLCVDRTSLRAALSELAGRNILKPLRGSGVVVLDYREHGGLDFLDAVFSLPNIDLGSALHLEILDHWIDVMPVIIKKAVIRSTPADLASIDHLFKKQVDMMKNNPDIHELAAIEVLIQDEIINLAGGTILKMFANSTRRLRVQFAASFFKTVDIRKHINYQRDLIRIIMAGESTPDETADNYRKYLIKNTSKHRTRISRLPANPTRLDENKLSSSMHKK